LGIVEHEQLYKQRKGSGEFGLLTEMTGVGMEGKFSRQAPCPSEKRDRERETERKERKTEKTENHTGI